jgi:hypothetical protein
VQEYCEQCSLVVGDLQLTRAAALDSQLCLESLVDGWQGLRGQGLSGEWARERVPVCSLLQEHVAEVAGEEGIVGEQQQSVQLLFGVVGMFLVRI